MIASSSSSRGRGPGETPDGLPRFADGLRAAQLTAAVLESAAAEQWTEVDSA